jgi:AcrR family transcriptional regulator
MRRGPIAKSEATRERILEAAFELFDEKGYTATTMREIAARASCSPGLSYRYFRSKDAITLALYERMLDEFSEMAHSIDAGSLSQRWAALMRADFERLAVHRNALTGLTTAGLAHGSSTQVLGEETRHVRVRMLAIFGAIVAGAADVPKSVKPESLARVLFGLHLQLVLFWLQDPTSGQSATIQLIGLIERLLGVLRFAIRLPWLRDALEQLSDILKPILEGDETAY